MQFSASCCAGKLEEAIEHLTEAISLNPTSAIMYATRGTLSLFFFCKVSCWSYGSCMNEICLYNLLYVVNIVNL